MSDDPSREELLAMLSGEGFTGGAKKKKRNPWLSFLKKHPNLSMAEASKKYHAKGRGVDGDMEGGMTEGEDEFYIEGGKIKRRRRKKSTRKRRGRGVEEYMGGADPSSISTDKEAWRTPNVKLISRYIKIGDEAFKSVKKIFPQEYAKARKMAGAGVTFQDYVRFAKGDVGSKLLGEKLREEWNKEVGDGKKYLNAKEQLLVALGTTIVNGIFVKGNGPIKTYESDELSFIPVE